MTSLVGDDSKCFARSHKTSWSAKADHPRLFRGADKEDVDGRDERDHDDRVERVASVADERRGGA
jgi:hypothetical protein